MTTQTTPSVQISQVDRISDGSVPFEYSTCPAPPQPTENQDAEAMAKMLNASGVTACKQSNEQYAGRVVMAAVSPVAIGGGAATVDVNKTSNLGCEQVLATAKKYQQAVQNVACILKKSKNVIDTVAKNVNSITWDAGRDANVDCKNITVNQSIGARVVQELKLTEQEKTDIASQTKSVVQDMITAVQDSKTEAGATPQGSKILIDVQNKIDNIDYKADVNETLNQVSTKINNENVVIFKAGRDINVRGEQCTFNQDILLDLMASNIIDSSIDKTMSTIGDYFNQLDQETKQKSENKGPDMGKSFWKGLFNVAGMGVWGLVIIIVIVVLVIIVGAVVLLPKLADSKAGQAATEAGMAYAAGVPLGGMDGMGAAFGGGAAGGLSGLGGMPK